MTLRTSIAGLLLAFVCLAADDGMYVLGPGDVLTLSVRDSDEISNKTYRVEENGELRVPLLGWVKAGGLTAKQLEALLVERLKPHFLEPEVQVHVTEYQSHPVSVIGSVNAPGVQQLHGPTTLAELLSRAGGPRTDAGDVIRVTRHIEPGQVLPLGAKLEPGGDSAVVEVPLAGIMEGTNPAGHLQVLGHDTVSIPPADIVYVLGEVKKTGGFVISRRSNISVLEALAMAEGLTGTAETKKAAILRPVPGSKRREVAVDLKQVLAGKTEDPLLRPNDILFVPAKGTTFKRAAVIGVQATLGVVTGVAIWRLGATR